MNDKTARTRRRDDIDSDNEIHARLSAGEMSDCIRSVIDRLPEAYRSALILHDMEGLSAEQTAEISECSAATAKIMLRIAGREKPGHLKALQL